MGEEQIKVKCQELSEKLGKLINEYSGEVPLLFINKILSGVILDIQNLEQRMLIKTALEELQSELREKCREKSD